MSSHYVTFWGVRGSHPVPGPDTQRYGGNTACVEIKFPDAHLIVDLGSGAKNLGEHLLSHNQRSKYSVFFSHYHWDHVMGIPFFRPFYHSNLAFDLYGPKIDDTGSPLSCINHIMRSPHFPIPSSFLNATLTEHCIDTHCTHPIPGSVVKVSVRPMQHSEGTVGYRFDDGQKVVAYASDTEHPENGLDPNILELAQNADVFIYDSMFTNNQYYSKDAAKKGWGHSTWEVACDIAKEAKVKTLVLFHHNTTHSDSDMDDIGAHATALFPFTIVAKEGHTLPL